MILSGSKYIQHDIESHGLKILNKVPDVIKEYVPVSHEDTIIDTGGLVNIYKFMKNTKSIMTSRKTSLRYDPDKWSGCKTYDEYLKLLNVGDEAIISKIKVFTDKKLKQLNIKYKDSFKGYKFDVEGQFFDIGKVLEGVPEAWLRPDPNEEQKPRVTIKLDLTFAAVVSSDDMIEGASRVLSIVKFLEEHEVEVRLMSLIIVKKYRTDNKSNFLMITNIKEYSEKINYAKVSALVSPTLLRRGYFKIVEMVAGEHLVAGYGKVENKLEGYVRINIKSDVDYLEKELLGAVK